MSRSEKAILNDTLVAVSAEPETIAWRNNTGQAWAGGRVGLITGQVITISDPKGGRPARHITVTQSTTLLLNSQPITFGLPGSGDILGASAGRPLSVEVKDATGRQSDIQKRFEAAWVRAGGIYLLVRSPEEAVAALRAHGGRVQPFALQPTEITVETDDWKSLL